MIGLFLLTPVIILGVQFHTSFTQATKRIWSLPVCVSFRNL